MPAPNRSQPLRISGRDQPLGGCQRTLTMALTIGAPANTSGATYRGLPPNLIEKMMHSAPAAPAIPPSVANVRAYDLNSPESLVNFSFSPPATSSDRTISGMTTAVTKYAIPTHRNARN